MNVVLYYFKKKLLNGANDIEGYWGNFDFKKDKISDFKLMFILPNGKCLFMPYSPNDIGRREGEYEHLIYMLNAIDMILEEFQIDKKKFINEWIDKLSMREFISYIFSLRISFFYDLKSNTSIFFKSYSFSEKQEKILAQLKRQLEKENLKIAVYASLKDNNMIITDEVVDENSFGKYIYNRKERGMDINEFYKVIKIDKEKIR